MLTNLTKREQRLLAQGDDPARGPIPKRTWQRHQATHKRVGGFNQSCWYCTHPPVSRPGVLTHPSAGKIKATRSKRVLQAIIVHQRQTIDTLAKQLQMGQEPRMVVPATTLPTEGRS
jgi:hypothetical protein